MIENEWEIEDGFRDSRVLVKYNGLDSAVTIPADVTEIGEDAFKDCTTLVAVTIPDGVTRIGELAFKGCKNLAEVSIPASVASIGMGAFADCFNLKRVNYAGTKKQWKEIDVDELAGTGIIKKAKIIFGK